MANPVLSRADFVDAAALPASERMTLGGTVTKTGVLMLLCAVSAAGIWMTSATIGPSISTAITVTAIAALVIAMATIFRPTWAPITAPLYAIAEGTLLGAITVMINLRYAGLPLTALGLTLAAGGVMLALYTSRVIRVTARLRAIVIGSVFAIMLYYVFAFVAHFFGVQAPLLQDSGWMSIGFSLLVVGVASFSFLLDFDMIEQAVNHGAPRYFEWYGAFGVIVTFVWLYLEILNLLMKLSGRQR